MTGLGSPLHVLALVLSGAMLGCDGPPIEVGGAPPETTEDPDTLPVPVDPAPGSFDAIHRAVLLPSCAGQAGMCHSGQFEPNLSTPANAYVNLVWRPSLEHEKRLRVAPGSPDESLLVDKLRNRNVATQMPLGASPLAEDDIRSIEEWISGGALRAAGTVPTPALNNPPFIPELAVFDATGASIAATGPAAVAVGDALTFRMSVRDFETEDQDMSNVAFVLVTSDEAAVRLSGGGNPEIQAAVDGRAAPMGTQDSLNWSAQVTLPPTVTLVYDDDRETESPIAGLALYLRGTYRDGTAADSIAAYAISESFLEIAP